ncbi:lipoprotein [Dyadobacter bucti]|uniref:lipoprotein n=1 Tax=Dyadobacter bucti TaxID=2572203 RepID=UPI0011080C13|nr:lipoprotein [Dyadobacter bucti]
MKQILFLLFVLFILSGCKKDDTDTPPQIEGIVGKWQLTETEITENGRTVWQEAGVYDKPYYFSIRFDGVLLDDKDLPMCCSPQSLTVNGFLFAIEPKASVPINPLCAAVSCAQCPNWEIEQTGDQMIITTCGISLRSKYVRK